MDKEPTIEDHIAFRKLLEQQDPVALQVHGDFSKNKNHSAFSAGVIRAVRGGASNNKISGRGNVNSGKKIVSKQPSTNIAPSNICRNMLTTGKCKNGSKCKFSHNIAQTEAGVASPTRPAKIALRGVPLAGITKPSDSDPHNEDTSTSIDNQAAKSRFLGLFGVRPAVPPAEENNPPPPPSTSSSHHEPSRGINNKETDVDAPMQSTQESSTVSSNPPQSPARTSKTECGLEDLLLNGTPSRTLATGEANTSKPMNSQDPRTTGPPGMSESRMMFGRGPSPGPHGPPMGFPGPLPGWNGSPAPHGFPFGAPNHMMPPGFADGLPHLHPGGPMPPPGHPLGHMPPPPPGYSGPHPGFFGGPPGHGPPGHGLPGHGPPGHGPPGHGPPGYGPPGHGPPGYGPPGHGPPGHGPPPQFPGFMPPPPAMHMQQQQLPPGQFGQAYNTMCAAPPQLPPPPMSTQNNAGFRGVSVHDMLASKGDGGAQSAEEKSRRLLEMLSIGSSGLQNDSTASNAAAVPTAGSTTDNTSNTTTMSETPIQSTSSGSNTFSKPLTPSSAAAGGPQQKSRALLSLMKSTKAGPNFSAGGSSPAPSTENTSTAGTPRGDRNTVSPVQSTATESTPTVDTLPSDTYSTPVKSKPRSSTLTSLDEGLPGHAGATPARKASFFRNTRFQTGTLRVVVDREVRKHHVMRPAVNMAVQWQIPQAEFHALMNKSSSCDIVIGLVRYGSYTNSPCFVAKPIERRPRLAIDSSGQPVYQGAIPFHAPKSAGQFVYRMFDQSSKESILTTIASSSVFTVELTDFHVNTNLKHILEALNEKSKLKGISQMPTVLRGIRNNGRSDRSTGSADGMLNDAVLIVLKAIQEASGVIKAYQERKEEITAQAAVAPLVALENQKDSSELTITDEMRSAFKQALRIHLEAYETIVTIMESRVLWNMLPETTRSVLALQEHLYCPHLQRCFTSENERKQCRLKEYGFDFTDSMSSTNTNSTITTRLNNNNNTEENTILIWKTVNKCINELIPTLLPNSNFQLLRETAAGQLQLSLLTENAIPIGTEVALFGSSANSFGSDGADLDMTLLFPASVQITAEDKPIVIERLGAVLSKFGMSDVSVRATARIPIVQFKDPLHGLDCDISLQNQLAVANTRLLRTYGSVDPRVRTLAFLLKYWAKKRHLNAPSDGTLSSYGWILCLIHFLQNRPIPLIPNLQQLSPVWSGARHEIPSEVPLTPGFINPGFLNNSHIPSVYQQQVIVQQLEDGISKRFEKQSLPSVTIMSADNIKCNTYFYTPTLVQPDLLSSYARQNEESVAQLLVEFFRYYAEQFDFRHSVVSIRQPRGLSKLDKAERDGWLNSDNLAIEDPFETHYDVAHVLKGAQMAYLRKELLRATTLAARMFTPASTDDALPATVKAEEFLTQLCADCEPPAFTSVAKEKAAAAVEGGSKNDSSSTNGEQQA